MCVCMFVGTCICVYMCCMGLYKGRSDAGCLPPLHTSCLLRYGLSLEPRIH